MKETSNEVRSIDVDLDALVIQATDSQPIVLNRKKERLIRIVNKCSYEIAVKAESKEHGAGWRSLAPGDMYVFSFTPCLNDFHKGRSYSTHYWAIVKYTKDNSKQTITFPIFGEGSPRDDNLFEVWPGSVYLDGRLGLTHLLVMHALLFAFLQALGGAT